MASENLARRHSQYFHPAFALANAVLRLEGPALCLSLSLATLVLRLPSLFEPAWHTDEGIFAAVGQAVASGGSLYEDAWESKPPLFLMLYAGIIKAFGAGVFQLHLAATVAAIASQWALFSVAARFMSKRQAISATIIVAVLLGVPFWEGTLALTETFALLPSTLAVLCVLKSKGEGSAYSGRLLFLAGLLTGVAFLIRQTAIVPLGAAGLWLLLSGQPWRRPALLSGAGFIAVVAPVLIAFTLLGSWPWFWDANAGFFFKYVPSGEELPFYLRPLIVLPALVTMGCLTWFRRRGESPDWGLPALWLTATLAAALLTGRPYSHYFLLAFPPLALLLALLLPHWRQWRPSRTHAPGWIIALTVAALWFGTVVPQFNGNPFAMHYTKGAGYYPNFISWAAGLKSDKAYTDYFDRRVVLTEQLQETLDRLGAQGKKVYIWGEYPWAYALADVKPADRYMTSFYVLLIPYLDTGLWAQLSAERPDFIVLTSDARVKLVGSSPIVGRRYAIARQSLAGLVERDYDKVVAVGKAEIYRYRTR